MLRKIWIVLGIVVVALAFAWGLFTWSGWTVAKGMATRIALGQSPADSAQATKDYYNRLRRPGGSTDVMVQTPLEDNFIRSGLEIQVNFIVTNLHDDRIPPVPYSVNVRLGPTGWRYAGFGSGG
jgi:hypothetical protein